MRALALALMLATPAHASGPVPFDEAWTEQNFRLFSGNDYRMAGSAMEVQSNGAVSLVWRVLPEAFWTARRAGWDWAVEAGVPATDLTVKGGDDRNLALYFVFLPEAEARAMAERPNIRKLLGSEEARVLVYVWGGAREGMLDSPYLGPRGKTVVLRAAGEGAHVEGVDLSADYARAFGGDAPALVGLAVSADSDDTASVIRAGVRGDDCAGGRVVRDHTSSAGRSEGIAFAPRLWSVST
jgi:hypothetical protein